MSTSATFAVAERASIMISENEPEFIVDLAARTIVIRKPVHSRSIAEPFTIHVPRLFGEFDRVERRGDYLVVFTEQGKTAYYLTRGHNNVGLESRIGFMTWHNLRKAMREHCIDRRFVARVDMLVNYYRNSGGNSREWTYGRVTVDDAIVYEGNEVASELGASLEHYLHLPIDGCLRSDDGMIRAFAVLDCRTTDAELSGCTSSDCPHPLWAAFLKLRRN
jgi:hypothetical protein